MESEKRIQIVGFALIAAFIVTTLIIGLLHWSIKGFGGLALSTDLNYLGYVVLISMAYGTSVHLWSRVPALPEGLPIKTLFKMMGFSFLVIGFIFVYTMMDTLLRWAGLPGWSDLIDVMPVVEFDLFGLTDVTMPVSSVVMFAIIMVGVAIFIFPLERFVKNRKPWFTISMVISLCIIPFMIFFTGVEVAVLAATVGIVLVVLINFIFMFYLYITLAVKSAGKMRTASVLVAVGLFSMIFVWVVGLGLFEKIVQVFVQFGIGIASLLMFNGGFRIMRP
ncbi:MAG: hypothetical protein JW839_14555 [Candidatus Lokiarchaeota archaeon]|nr:hypothetical protein [Candidatus Lokiarchaeota archaeon]